jgi:hypothetical protein
MDVHEIGTAAGQVWAYLVEKGEAGRTELKREIEGMDDFKVAAAIGWLAREDKIAFVPAGRSFHVVLK